MNGWERLQQDRHVLHRVGTGDFLPGDVRERDRGFSVLHAGGGDQHRLPRKHLGVQRDGEGHRLIANRATLFVQPVADKAHRDDMAAGGQAGESECTRLVGERSVRRVVEMNDRRGYGCACFRVNHHA
ncbi:MAG: hypothetical protein BWY06_03275 [Candidatus Latescibacteria bacterium ADurb.Bin168]|nr:MAG: hypothetical protein BWY06_03275 [Candidatus Latescibacteria bacterium ADurb.Bin168]